MPSDSHHVNDSQDPVLADDIHEMTHASLSDSTVADESTAQVIQVIHNLGLKIADAAYFCRFIPINFRQLVAVFCAV